MPGSVLLAVGLAILLACGLAAAWIIARWTGWRAAGAIALIVAAPLVPYHPLALGLSADDLLPLLGLLLLLPGTRLPSWSRDRPIQVVLVGVMVAVIARVMSALVNGGDVSGTATMLAQGVGRPAVLLAVAIGVRSAVGSSSRRFETAGFFFVVMGTVEALLSLVAFAVPALGDVLLQPTSSNTSLANFCGGRIAGTLGLSANHVAAVLLVTILITVGLATQRGSGGRWWLVLAAAVQVAAVVLTFTRSSTLLALVAVVLLGIIRRRLWPVAGTLLVGAMLVAGVLSAGCPRSAPDVGGTFVGRLQDGNDRAALWYASARIMVDHPLGGVGLDRSKSVVLASPERYGATPFGKATNSAHNTILLAGAETGIAGAVALLAINVGLFWLALRAMRNGRRTGSGVMAGCGIAVAALLAQGMVNNLMTVPATSLLLATLAGLIATRAAGGEGERPDEPATPGGVSAG